MLTVPPRSMICVDSRFAALRFTGGFTTGWNLGRSASFPSSPSRS